MKITKHKKRVTTEELRKAIRTRRRQLAFDKYPKELQDFLTRTGANPYLKDSDDIIEYRTLTITVKE